MPNLLVQVYTKLTNKSMVLIWFVYFLNFASFEEADPHTNYTT